MHAYIKVNTHAHYRVTTLRCRSCTSAAINKSEKDREIDKRDERERWVCDERIQISKLNLKRCACIRNLAAHKKRERERKKTTLSKEQQM